MEQKPAFPGATKERLGLPICGTNAPWTGCGEGSKHPSSLRPHSLWLGTAWREGATVGCPQANGPSGVWQEGKLTGSLVRRGLVPKTWRGNEHKGGWCPRWDTSTAVARAAPGAMSGVSSGGIAANFQRVLWSRPEWLIAKFFNHSSTWSLALKSQKGQDTTVRVRVSMLNTEHRRCLTYVSCRNGTAAELPLVTAFHKQKITQMQRNQSTLWQRFQKKKHLWEYHFLSYSL